MKSSSYRLSLSLTAAGTLLLVGGLLLPAAFGAAGAQAPEPLLTPVQNRQSPEAAATTADEETQPMTVVVRRDPFVTDDATASEENLGDQGAIIVSQMQTVSLPPGMHVVPIGAAGAFPNGRVPQAPRDGITGIVVGEHPYALANMDGRTRVLSIGDTFQGRQIMRISLQGVTFDDRSIAHIPLLDQ